MHIIKRNTFFDYGEELKIMDCDVTAAEQDKHSHEFLEIAYITEGTGKHLHGQCESIVQKGDYIILDLSTKHSFCAFEGQHFLVTNCIFKPELIDNSLSKCKSFSDILENYLLPYDPNVAREIKIGTIFKDSNQEISMLFNKIKNEYLNRNTGFEQMSRVYLIEIIILTIRSAVTDQSECRYFTDDIKLVKEYIDADFTKDISLAQLASHINISASALSRKYKSVTGTGITEYKQNRRIELACRLLSNTKKKFPEVVELCGYCDVKYFAALFKRVTGVSPSKYRHSKRV